MLSKRDRKLLKGVAENQKFLIRENIMLKRKKTLNLEEKIYYLCMERRRSPVDIADEVGEEYNYVRRTMREMADKGDLEPAGQEILQNKATKNFYIVPIAKIAKEHYGVERFPINRSDGKLITEQMARREAFLITKKLFEEKGWKIGK